MSNLIEQGRENLRNQEELKVSSKEIFVTAIDLLATKGELVKGFPFLKHQILQHAVNSIKPEIWVEIKAGADLNKAKTVSMWIQGVGILRVQKERNKGQEVFTASEYKSGYGALGFRSLYSVDRARGYLNAIRQVKGELSTSHS